MADKELLVFEPPRIIGVADDADDPTGYIPEDLLKQGIDVIVPLWPGPVTRPGEYDTLLVWLKQVGQPGARIENIYYPADLRPEFIIRVGPEYLRVNGTAQLYYEVKDFDHNSALSLERTLTIDHVPIRTDLPEAQFPEARGGWINCDSVRKPWEGILFRIPPLTGFNTSQRCEIEWNGYNTPNASGTPIPNTYWKKTRDLSSGDIASGFDELILPYVPHIEPMVKNASGAITYSIYQGTRLLARSLRGHVMIERFLTGQPPCGPS